MNCCPETAAKRYIEEIREFFGLEPGEMPHFDVVHRGMGADAHSASLFPGDPLIEDREHIAAAVFSKAHNQWRVTLLPGVLLAAKHTVFLVTGQDKAEAVRAVFKEDYDPQEVPGADRLPPRPPRRLVPGRARRRVDGLGAMLSM